MKKKAKLFTTIASLCLAVALMAFGVYAANATTVTINSKLEYTVGSNVIMKIRGNAGDVSKVGATHLSLTSTDYTEFDETATGTGAEKTLDLGDVDIKAGNVAVYTFGITNLNKNDALKAEVTVTFPDTFTAQLKVGNATATDLTTEVKATVDNAIAKAVSDEVVVSIILTVKDTTKDITTEADNLTILFDFADVQA